MNKPKREDYATAADFHFWMCAWQHDEIERLREALIRVRGHTAYYETADRELLAGLLATIERITEAALAGAADQPAAAHPNALAGEAGDARLGRIAMRFVDRAGDYCEVDPAERICDEFSKAMHDEIERQWHERMARDAATADNAAAQPDACPHCGCTLERCEAARRRGAIACCPDCNHRAAPQPDAVSTNSVEVSSGLVVPFYYRLQDKRDPYRHMNFDPSAWNFILVPTTPGEGVVGYSAADNSPGITE